MIVVDTSVWIDHLRSGDAKLAELLNAGRVLIHSFVIGEIALGSLRQRETVLSALNGLPAAVVAEHEEVMHLIERRPLHGLGIGYIDAHLLASAKLTAGCTIWTRDKRLRETAKGLDLAAPLD